MNFKILCIVFLFHQIHTAQSRPTSDSILPSTEAITKKLPLIKEQKRQMSNLEKINQKLKSLIEAHSQNNPEKRLISVSKEFSSPWLYINQTPEYEVLLQIYYDPERSSNSDTVTTKLYYSDPETFEQKSITTTSTLKDWELDFKNILNIIANL